MNFSCGLAVLALGLSCANSARAQIISLEKRGDKTVSCMRSGLSSDLEDCGNRSDWYSYVFVGQISVIAPSEKGESEIQIRPEEVFLGKPENPVRVFTSQGWCLPKLSVGDRWLFYLRKSDGKAIILDYYGNDSLPIANAQREIKTLRRLQSIGDFGLLRGRIMQGERFDGEIWPNSRVTAIRSIDQRQYSTVAGSDGRYEFEPLPSGDYKLKVTSAGSRLPDDSGITLKGGACLDLTLTRSPHASISGHVTRSDGSPAGGIDVVLIAADNSWYLTETTDRKGKFSFDSQAPGEFVVGFNFPVRPDWIDGSGAGKGVTLPPASWFYPNVPNRSSAHVIRLRTDEKLNNINVILPAN